MKPRKPTAAERAAAAEIADALGERAPRPRKQIERIVGLMGEAWTRDVATAATILRARTDTEITRARFPLRPDGKPRSLGGVFFVLARGAAQDDAIPRREFFRCFTDRAPRDDSHEARAVALFAQKANAAAAEFTVVREPRDGVWYDWADPKTGAIGQCRRERGAWAQAPRGERPVVLEWRKPVRHERRNAAPQVEVYTSRRAGR